MIIAGFSKEEKEMFGGKWRHFSLQSQESKDVRVIVHYFDPPFFSGQSVSMCVDRREESLSSGLPLMKLILDTRFEQKDRTRRERSCDQ